MTGQLVPLVLVPRHSTLAGKVGPTEDYLTVPIDVTPYRSANVTVWRGHVIGTVPPPPPPPPSTFAFLIWFEESTDRVTWSVCIPNYPDGDDPGENTQKQYLMQLTKRWFRARIRLFDADNVVSCFAVGSMEERVR